MSAQQTQQQQRAAIVPHSGAAMPWGSAAGGPAPLMPASMTFGLPFAGGFGGSKARSLPFASVSAGAFATAAKESHTGVAFPDKLCVISSRNCPGLAGVG
jgi:hypothetical protein